MANIIDLDCKCSNCGNTHIDIYSAPRQIKIHGNTSYDVVVNIRCTKCGKQIGGYRNE